MTSIKHIFVIALTLVVTACVSSTSSQDNSEPVDIYGALRNDNIQYRTEGDQEVSQTSPEFIDGKLREIRNAFFRKDYETAGDTAERLLRIDGNVAEAYYWLSRIRMEQADFQQAYDFASRGLSVSPERNMQRELERIQRAAQMGAQ